VLPDLVKTSIIERFAALSERKSMSDKMNTLIQPRAVFLKMFAVVFLLVLFYSVAVSFLLPETYASTAQIKVEQEDHVDPSAYDSHFLQTTFEIIQSQLILEPVIDKLNLNVMWGKKYGVGAFKTSETMGFLTNMMALSPVRNTSLVDITVYSGDKKEAAQIANAIAESFQDYLVKTHAS
jgi:polysaccharide biosynthesis transport protein